MSVQPKPGDTIHMQHRSKHGHLPHPSPPKPTSAILRSLTSSCGARAHALRPPAGRKVGVWRTGLGALRATCRRGGFPAVGRLV